MKSSGAWESCAKNRPVVDLAERKLRGRKREKQRERLVAEEPLG
jgi:hypothetical protein